MHKHVRVHDTRNIVYFQTCQFQTKCSKYCYTFHDFHLFPSSYSALSLSLTLTLSVSLFQIRRKIDRMIELMHGTKNLPGFAKIESKVGRKLFPHDQYTPFYL